jgi:hypothetical protein
MIGERNCVAVLVDGKLTERTSHQDVPLSLEVHMDRVKHRNICVRADLSPESDLTADDGRKAATPESLR